MNERKKLKMYKSKSLELICFSFLDILIKTNLDENVYLPVWFILVVAE